ncbi:DUF202 domain-containing protein [Mycobacterium sp. PS03-16]|uniref:DUF202 domain-containing protein n=1 Tax=Mycobacterium sp. PS03-16 TaxID=2559611 RepID=UPI00107468DA|nr:DUF202 domain-containing protein [Mycobacterium sp. PS03-16]TFV60346.1 DUF202 domain-containing protein [Mycobacterium sp. PS03-16]
MTGAAPADRGLQAERTALAWTRTSFAVLANGALLMLRDLKHHSAGLGLVAGMFAVVIAALIYVMGMRRQRTLLTRPLPRRITPRREVYVLAGAVLVLIAVSVAALPF